MSDKGSDNNSDQVAAVDDHKGTTGSEGGGGGVERQEWPNRAAFYFAAVGSAVGFGNVWRFPALAKEYGGGAFFIPYLLALFLIGIPILVLEIGFGQYFQTGDVGVFGGFNRRFRGVGLSSVACGFMLVTYYSMLIAWVVRAFFESWGDDAPWTDDGVNGTVAINYFLNDIIGQATLGEDGTPTRIVPQNVGYATLVWFLIYLCVAFGVEWTGRVVYVTMGIPIILLFVFLGRACTLDGSSVGVRAYIGEWDVSVLKEQGDVWSTAVSQIFFSIGITFGIMTAYGSHCPRNEPAFVNSVVVACSNSMFSFISGFAVFASLGHLAHISGMDIDDLKYAGFSLVFGTWPVVLGTLPGGAHWVRLLFFDLFLLGIDSAFSFIHGFATVFQDTAYFQHTPSWKMCAIICVPAWLLSLIYATDAGLNFLDVVDFYINFTMLIVGFFESFAAGWIYKWDEQEALYGQPALFAYLTANFGSVAVACAVWFGAGSTWGGFVALIGIYVIGLAVTLFLLQKRMQDDPERWPTLMSIFGALAFKNILDLKERIEPVIGFIPIAWCVLIKQFIPHVLLILFVNLAQSDNGKPSGDPIFGNYGDFVTLPFQVLGILTFVFAATTFMAGFFVPAIYEPFRLPEGHFGLENLEDDGAVVAKELDNGDSSDDGGVVKEAGDGEEVDVDAPLTEASA